MARHGRGRRGVWVTRFLRDTVSPGTGTTTNNIISTETFTTSTASSVGAVHFKLRSAQAYLTSNSSSGTSAQQVLVVVRRVPGWSVVLGSYPPVSNTAGTNFASGDWNSVLAYGSLSYGTASATGVPMQVRLKIIKRGVTIADGDSVVWQTASDATTASDIVDFSCEFQVSDA